MATMNGANDDLSAKSGVSEVNISAFAEALVAGYVRDYPGLPLASGALARMQLEVLQRAETGAERNQGWQVLNTIAAELADSPGPTSFEPHDPTRTPDGAHRLRPSGQEITTFALQLVADHVTAYPYEPISDADARILRELLKDQALTSSERSSGLYAIDTEIQRRRRLHDREQELRLEAARPAIVAAVENLAIESLQRSFAEIAPSSGVMDDIGLADDVREGLTAHLLGLRVHLPEEEFSALLKHGLDEARRFNAARLEAALPKIIEAAKSLAIASVEKLCAESPLHAADIMDTRLTADITEGLAQLLQELRVHPGRGGVSVFLRHGLDEARRFNAARLEAALPKIIEAAKSLAIASVEVQCAQLPSNAARIDDARLTEDITEGLTQLIQELRVHPRREDVSMFLQHGLEEARRFHGALERQQELVRRKLNGNPASPPPQPYGVSHEGAEALVSGWMQHLGAVDSQVTSFTADGGIDVVSARYIAQVKNYSDTVGVAALRELAGVASVDGRTPLFFSSGSYAAGAIEFANLADIALFRYDAVLGTLDGINERGREAVATGLEWDVEDLTS